MGAQEHGDLLVPKLWDSRCAGKLGTCSVPSSTRPRFAFAPIQHCKQHRPAPQGSPPCGGGTGTPGGSCAPQRARAHPTHSRGRSAAALRPLSQPACCRSRSRPRKPQAKSRSSLPCAGAFPAGLTGISAPSRSGRGDGTGPRLRSLGKPLTASTTRALPAAIGGLLRVHSPGAGESFGETKGWFLPKKKKKQGPGQPCGCVARAACPFLATAPGASGTCGRRGAHRHGHPGSPGHAVASRAGFAAGLLTPPAARKPFGKAPPLFTRWKTTPPPTPSLDVLAGPSLVYCSLPRTMENFYDF